jgi:membrane dipeptidase
MIVDGSGSKPRAMHGRVREACFVLIFGLIVAWSGCSSHEATGANRAAVPVIDTHIDTPSRLVSAWEPVGESVPHFDFDYQRAKKGGLSVAFLSIYTASALEDSGTSREAADKEIEQVRRMVATWPDRFELVTSVRQIREKQTSGKVLLAMGMENGSPVDDDLGLVKRYYDMGIRYITLAHAKWNHLADGSYDTTRHWNGLSPFGRNVVNAMNGLGIMVDISHLTDSAAFQVLRISGAPVIASHSSCRFFTPGFERNISDDLIHAVGSNGGVVQVAFGVDFISAEAQKVNGPLWDSIAAHIAAEGWNPEGAEADAYAEHYWKLHPPASASVAQVADHIDHIVKLIGIDHVGIGSDFDGVSGLLPEALRDVSGYPNLFAELRGRGYSESDLRKIGSENLLRVWGAVEKASKR